MSENIYKFERVKIDGRYMVENNTRFTVEIDDFGQEYLRVIGLWAWLPSEWQSIVTCYKGVQDEVCIKCNRALTAQEESDLSDLVAEYQQPQSQEILTMALIHPTQITTYDFASDPLATDDNTLGYQITDLWVNTTTDDAFICVDDSTGAAIWSLVNSDFRNMNYNGTVDASNTGTNINTLTATAQTGDWYLVATTGGTENFNGTWDANASAPFVGATFQPGDAILFNGTTWDKIDNTQVFAAQQTYVDRVTAAATPTSGTPVTYAAFFTSGPAPAASKDLEVKINGQVADYLAVSISGTDLEINTTTLGFPIPPSAVITARWVAA